MLASSNIIISLGKSKDYLRSAVLLHIFSAIVLFKSSWPMMIKLGLCACLIVLLIHILRTRRPYSDSYELSHQKGYWLLHSRKSESSKHEKLEITFEGGIFFLLTFTGISPKKTMLIFYDQISSSDHRALMLLNIKK